MFKSKQIWVRLNNRYFYTDMQKSYNRFWHNLISSTMSHHVFPLYRETNHVANQISRQADNSHRSIGLLNVVFTDLLLKTTLATLKMSCFMNEI